MKDSGEFALIQLDTVIDRYTEAVDNALEGGNDARAAVLLELTEALEASRADVIDKIVDRLHYNEGMIALADRQADIYLLAKKRRQEAHEAIRIHIQNYIDTKLPKDNPKLLGALFWIRTQNNTEDRLEVHDEAQVPRQYFTKDPVQVILPGDADTTYLAAFLAEFYPGAIVKQHEGPARLNLTLVRAAIEKGESVPGAKLHRGRHLRYSKPAGSAPARRGKKEMPAADVETAAVAGVGVAAGV